MTAKTSRRIAHSMPEAVENAHMSHQLNELGAIKIRSGKLFGLMAGWPWLMVLLAVTTSYCYVHPSARCKYGHG